MKLGPLVQEEILFEERVYRRTHNGQRLMITIAHLENICCEGVENNLHREVVPLRTHDCLVEPSEKNNYVVLSRPQELGVRSLYHF